MDNKYLELPRAGEERVKLLIREEMKKIRKESRIGLAKGIIRYTAEMVMAVGLVRYFS
jgi:hypothetical protein